MPPPHLHLDFETFSEAKLKKVGAYRYAFDPSTEILCAAMALGDREPDVWRGKDETEIGEVEDYWGALENPEVLIYAHSAQFEMAICQALLMKTWGIACPDLNRFRCTASLARRAALPGGLDKLSEILNLTDKKSKIGDSLKKKFSVMQKAPRVTKKNPLGGQPFRIRPEDDPAAFAEFCAYCQQDVRTEQEVARRLAYFDSPINNANYSLDARINARGVTVNIGALQHAQKLIEEETEIVSTKFRELVGCEITQGAVFLEWLQMGDNKKHTGGINIENLQAETIETELVKWEGATLIPFAVEALRMKQSVAYAAIKKVATMLACAGPHDNRIRGLLTHHGANTGRWAASLVQFQNMKRPSPEFAAETFKGSGVTWSEVAYRNICEGISRDMLELCYGPPLEVISSCIRHFVHDTKEPRYVIHPESDSCFTEDSSIPFETDGCAMDVTREEYLRFAAEVGYTPQIKCCGSPLLDADYSAIEARIVNWLAGQEDALEEYRQGIDRYKVMASLIYGVPVDEVNKYPQRFVGKQAILLSGFQGGPSSFERTCLKYGFTPPLGLAELAVEKFRAKHKRVVSYWYDTEEAAQKAVLHKGSVFRITNKKLGPYKVPVFFQVKNIEGMEFLLLKLPSGRELSYPQPRLVPSRFEGKKMIQFFGEVGLTKQQGKSDTYGGKLVENITQAVAADIMANGAHNAENAGYEIATLIHDQALAYYRESQSSDEFVSLLTRLPSWADGLPIEAEGGLVPFYKKD